MEIRHVCPGGRRTWKTWRPRAWGPPRPGPGRLFTCLALVLTLYDKTEVVSEHWTELFQGLAELGAVGDPNISESVRDPGGREHVAGV